MSAPLNICVFLIVTLVVQVNQAQELTPETHDGTSTINLPGSPLERLSNISDQANVWVLLPLGANLTNLSLEGNYNLFKLDAGALDREGLLNSPAVTASSGSDQDENFRDYASPRRARKINFFKNVLNKPKVTPLYLVNGTVCRFVNSQPICTTLSTTGLIRPNQLGNNLQQMQQQQQQGGIFGQQQQNNNNNLQQGGRQAPFNQQFGPNQQFMPQQNGNFQQFQPAAVIDAETSDINVGVPSGNSTESSSQPSRSQGNRVQTTSMQVARPVSFVVSRRPLNLLSFGRPFRQYQAVSRRGLTAAS